MIKMIFDDKNDIWYKAIVSYIYIYILYNAYYKYI